MTTATYGFKGFECLEFTPEGKQRLKCRDQWYTIGETTHYSGVKDAQLVERASPMQIPSADIVMCKRGFHFCKELTDVNNYYMLGHSVIARVLVPIGGHLIDQDDKCVTNSLHVQALLSGKFESKGNIYVFEQGRLTYHMDTTGTQTWWMDGKIHRDGDLPAVIHANHRREDGLFAVILSGSGTQEWWKNGERHREGDLPAIIYCNGTQEWWMDGRRHRDGDLPSTILANGTREWWKNGELHRDGDLPAIIGANGIKQWWKNGELHRDGDLPAYIHADDTEEWWKNGALQRGGD